MNLGILAWANEQRADWKHSLKDYRAGSSGTFAVRHQKRIDTTIETIADLNRRLGELDAVIAQTGEPERDC